MNNQVFHIAVCDDVKMNTEEIAKLTEDICKKEQICPKMYQVKRAKK